VGIKIKRMKIGEIVDNFKVPPHPSNIILEGNLVRLEPLKADKHSVHLFESNAIDKEEINWTYLPYGPFETVEKYADWIKEFEKGNDPVFLAIIRKSDSKPVGIASYLRIKPNDGSIEVGHINYSPLLQNTTEGTEAMFLMMKWAFENGYRRYEWKCNALNIKSRNAAQRLGLSYEGVFRQMGIKKGRNRNTAWFAAIDKEWKDLKKCFENYLSDDNFDERKLPKVSLSSLTKPILYKLDNMEFS
jgi:RimJ/RimL family protein N-acetyltransferase